MNVNPGGIIPLEQLGLSPAMMEQLHREAKRTPPNPVDPSRARLSYYNREDAEALLGLIEFWRSKGFKPLPLNPATMIPPLQMNTLKTKIWNSKRYIIEVMLPAGDVASICSRIKLTAKGGIWVMSLNDKEEKQTGNGMIAGVMLDEMVDNDAVRTEFLEWISRPHEEKEKFVRPEDPTEDLALTDEDLNFFRERATEVADKYIAKISRTKVVFIRLTRPAEEVQQ